MFEDQTAEMLPERTTMRVVFRGGRGGNGGTGGNGGAAFGGMGGIAISINAGNINFGSGTQTNTAIANALGGAATGGAGGAGGGGGAGGAGLAGLFRY